MKSEKLLPSIRPARASDVEAILSLLTEVACQIPLDLSTPNHVAELRKGIEDDCLNDLSLVAVDVDNVVVGVQLAKKRQWFGDDCIHLTYAGVTAAAREEKIFRRLIEAEKANRLPLVAVVKPGNKSDMVARLQRYDFRLDNNNPPFNEFAYWWHPGENSG
jgi:hypothetical protein